MQKINFHSHIYTKNYLKALSLRRRSPRLVKIKPLGKTIVHGPFVTPITSEFYRIEKHIEDMSKDGSSLDLLSLANPWVDAFPSKQAVGLARSVNNELAGLQSKFPERFACLATLPFTNIPEATEELRRSVKELGLKGFIMGSNINGKSCASSDFMPIFEEAMNLDVPIFIHPTNPGGYSSAAAGELRDYGLMPVLGFVFDTTLNISKMIFSGMLERLPNVKIVAAHLGGTLPYLIGRLDRGYKGIPDCRARIKKPPSEYLRRLYCDTVSFHDASLRCGLEILGENKLMFGSDYPFALGSFSEVEQALSRVGITDEIAEKIYFENAAHLLRI